MASIFDTDDGACGIFAAIDDGTGTTRTLDFTRSVRSQNSAGEIEQIWQKIATITLDAQPTGGTVLREVHGQVAQVSYRLFSVGRTVLREFDRFYIEPTRQLEIINVMQYGDSHSEIECRYIGR